MSTTTEFKLASFKKVAFFVEGLTEMFFLQKLLSEVVTEADYAFEVRQMRGGSKSVSQIYVLDQKPVTTNTKCFILITECGGDSTVKSYLMDSRVNLIASGYSVIIGIVDLYPRAKADLHKWKYGLNLKVPQLPIPIKFIIPVMEIEAWFIAENKHFIHIDPLLNDENVNLQLGIDLQNVNTEDFIHPAQTLDDIYHIANKSYSKNRHSIQRTVEILDYADICFTLPDKIESLRELIDLIKFHIL